MNKLVLALLCLFSLSIFSQTENKGNPKSWDLNLKANINTNDLGAINLKKIMAEDVKNDGDKDKPFRIGVPIKANYNLTNSGVWNTLENGDRIWRLNLSSKDALNLSVNFSDFFMPKGAYLQLYNDDKTDLIGAYTSKNNNSENMLGSWFVKGDTIWLEYYEPKSVIGQGRLEISDVIHVYRFEGQHEFTKNTKLNESGACNQDVDCPVGADFDATKDIVKHAVAFFSMGNGYICSGTLINNTNNDKTPYFLTANHCFADGNGSPSNPALYSMRFNWITSGTPRCGVTTNTSAGPTNQVMYGATLKAKHTLADFMLVQLNNSVPSYWDIQFAGWDRSDTTPSFEVGIHHPSGDIMKVCRNNDSAIATTTSGVPIWVIGGTSFGGGNGWELGVTEGGSSGSALFDQNGRIIGQLWAGSAACVGTNDNNEIDYYGRISSSWTGGGTSTTRLSDWLDPSNTGDLTTDTLSVTAAVDQYGLARNIEMYPNPTKGILNFELNSNLDYSYSLFDVLGKEVLSDKLTPTLDISNLKSNIYFIKIHNNTNNTTTVNKIILSK